MIYPVALGSATRPTWNKLFLLLWISTHAMNHSHPPPLAFDLYSRAVRKPWVRARSFAHRGPVAAAWFAISYGIPLSHLRHAESSPVGASKRRVEVESGPWGGDDDEC